MAHDDLFETYANTAYSVFPGAGPAGDVEVLRVGQRHPGLDRRLSSLRLARPAWAFITAWNPASQPLPLAENEARNAELEARVKARGFPLWKARAAADDGSCSEDSFLVLGIAEEEARALGRSFGQLAIVVGEVGGAARLVACDSPGSPA